MHISASEPSASPTTKWRPWHPRSRRRCYVDVTAGHGLTDDGNAFRCPPQLSLRELADALPAGVELAYFCGELPTAPQIHRAHESPYSAFNSWVATARPSAEGERVYLDSGATHDRFIARLRKTDSGYVEIRTVASWFGINDCTPEIAQSALALVTQQLQRQYGWRDVSLLSTPAATGLELWHTSISANRASGYTQSIEYPLLPEDLRRLIRATEGQGRFEYQPPSSKALPDGRAPSLVTLDMRLAYAAPAMLELGVAPARYDFSDRYEGYTPARYRIRFRIPDDWAHVGLFMVKDSTGAGWCFPRTPGETAETWADAAELRVALGPFPHRCPTCKRCYQVNDGAHCPRHGWPFTIKERIIFTTGKPLVDWARKLVDARKSCRGHELAEAAIRNLLLHGVGGFHAQRRPATKIAEATYVPDHTPTRMVLSPTGEEWYTWDEPGIPRQFADYDRPEWSSQVWAKTRARLLLHRDFDASHQAGRDYYIGALTLPFEDILAFRLDSILTVDNPGWPDFERPGNFRIKGAISEPVPWPQSEADIAALKPRLTVN